MILNKLSLTNFRNYIKSEFSFSATINLIVGPNSAGKTNILEAIYLIATGKSFRVRGVESEMIRYGNEMSNVKCKMLKGDDLEIILTEGEVAGEKTAKKKYLINGVSKRAIDFIGNLRAVYFGPEDLELILGSPSIRRRYLDNVLSQVDREYIRASLSYEKGLRSRNKILEEMREFGSSDRRQLYFWDQLLIKNGNLITDRREELMEFVNRKPLTANHQFSVEYDPSQISPKRLAQYSSEEVAAGITLVGPHRDDFKVKLGARDLSVYGSRGEERLAVLWLRLCELAFIKEKTGETPLLLLDDIFSELDVNHRRLVLEIVEGKQAIITTADLGMLEKPWLAGVKIIMLP